MKIGPGGAEAVTGTAPAEVVASYPLALAAVDGPRRSGPGAPLVELPAWREEVKTWPRDFQEEWAELARAYEATGRPRAVAEWLAWDIFTDGAREAVAEDARKEAERCGIH